MKTLEEDKLEQLLQIIQDTPGQRIVHFSDDSHILTKHLSECCKIHEGDYYLNCTKDEWRDILTEQYYVSTNIIDDLFEHYDVIVSKRMHGWGDI
ncbi:MAG: hypothetical protein B6D54_00785 [Epsilonproteobacteria bacterium 4484_65]|nr:MAG: hypothetical protein B6D54_00785 [Epsilonproteobacteria bacterium 4484_65]